MSDGRARARTRRRLRPGPSIDAKKLNLCHHLPMRQGCGKQACGRKKKKRKTTSKRAEGEQLQKQARGHGLRVHEKPARANLFSAPFPHFRRDAGLYNLAHDLSRGKVAFARDRFTVKSSKRSTCLGRVVHRLSRQSGRTRFSGEVGREDEDRK